MKKILAIILALSMALILSAYGSNQGQANLQSFADQEEFVKAMAKGLSNRIKYADDEKDRTAEEIAAYLTELVNYELTEIEEYDAITFEDELFDELAHAYINSCKMQLLSSENYQNTNLFPSLWNAGSNARASIIVEMYSQYDLPLTEEEAAIYLTAQIADGNKGNEENETANKGPEEKDKTIGDITIVDDFECQVKEVNWYSSSDFAFDIIERVDGYEYIVIVLSETNTTASTENAPMMSLLSADGYQCSTQMGLSLYKNQYKINFGATMAGATAEAYVIFQIPSGAETFKLQILSNGFGSDSEYIVFTRDDIH